MRLNALALYFMLPCSMVLLGLTAVSVKAQTPGLQETYTLDTATSDAGDLLPAMWTLSARLG